MTSINGVELREKSVRAIEARLQGLNGEPVAGVAICTDDGLSTYSVAVLTREVLKKRGGKDLLFRPTDWPDTALSPEECEVGDLLRNGSSVADDFEEFQDAAFESLVESLSAVVKSGQVPSDAFLSVLSTDPDEYMEELENKSVERLNDVHLVERRNRFLAKWA